MNTTGNMTSSTIHSSNIIPSSILLIAVTVFGCATTFYSMYLLLRWHPHIPFYPFLVNLILSSFLVCLFAAPGQAISIVLASLGSPRSNMCFILLILWKVTITETYVNMACMVGVKAYLAWCKAVHVISPAYTYMLMAFPWLIGLAYGGISSVWWCFTRQSRLQFDAIQACRVWEILHGEVLSGANIRKMDHIIYAVSLIVQFLGYFSLIMSLKHSHEVVDTYHAKDIKDGPGTGITKSSKTVRVTGQTVSFNETPIIGDDNKHFSTASQSSHRRVKTSTQNKVSSAYSDKTVRFHRSLSARNFGGSALASKRRVKKLTRGMSDTDLVRSIPGYIPDASNKESADEPSKLTSSAQAQADIPDRFVHSWRNLKLPVKTNGDCNDTDACNCKKASNVDQKNGRSFVNDIKESPENSFCASNNRSRSSNGTTSPNSLRPPLSLRSGSFQSYSSGLSSETLSGYLAGPNFARNITQNIPEAWMTDEASPERKQASGRLLSRHAATSTRSLDDVSVEPVPSTSNTAEAASPGTRAPKRDASTHSNVYTDTWSRMSTLPKTPGSNNPFCENLDQLTPLEKIKHWRTASVDCSTVLTSDLDEPTFFDICFAPDMKESISLEDIRSVSQITAPSRATETVQFATHEEEDGENPSTKVPIKIRVIRPSATLTTEQPSIRNDNHGLKENETIWESSESNFTAVEERKDSENVHETQQLTRNTLCRDSMNKTSKQIRSTTIAKVSQTDVRISGNGTKKLLRMNSESSIHIAQTTNSANEEVTQDFTHDMTSHDITQDVSHKTTDNATESPVNKELLMRRLLLNCIANILAFIIFHVPAILYESHFKDHPVSGTLSVLLILECFPYMWFAVAPFLYIISMY